MLKISQMGQDIHDGMPQPWVHKSRFTWAKTKLKFVQCVLEARIINISFLLPFSPYLCWALPGLLLYELTILSLQVQYIHIQSPYERDHCAQPLPASLGAHRH